MKICGKFDSVKTKELLVTISLLHFLHVFLQVAMVADLQIKLPLCIKLVTLEVAEVITVTHVEIPLFLHT